MRPRRILTGSQLAAERLASTEAVPLWRWLGELARSETEKLPANGATLREVARLALLGGDGRLGRLGGGSASEHAHLVKSLDDTLGSLRAAGTTAEDLALTGTDRGRTLAGLLDRADRELERRGAFDPRALPGAAREGARGPAFESIELRGVVDFSPALLRLLAGLHQSSREVGGQGVRVVLPRFDDPEHPMSALGSYLERAFAESPDPIDLAWEEPAPPEHVTVISAQTPRAEARAIAARVSDALAEGAAPEQIAIATPSLAPLRDALLVALDDARIPYADLAGRPLLDRPEARGLLGALELCERGFSRDFLMEWLRLPGLHAGRVFEERSARAAARQAERLTHLLARVTVLFDPDGSGIVAAVASQERAEPALKAAAGRLVQVLGRLATERTLLGAGRALLALVEGARLGKTTAEDLAQALGAEKLGVANAPRALAEGAM